MVQKHKACRSIKKVLKEKGIVPKTYSNPKEVVKEMLNRGLEVMAGVSDQEDTMEKWIQEVLPWERIWEAASQSRPSQRAREKLQEL